MKRKVIVSLIFTLFFILNISAKSFNQYSKDFNRARFKENFTLLKKIKNDLSREVKKNYRIYYLSAKIDYEFALNYLSKNDKRNSIIWIEKSIKNIRRSISLNRKFSDSHRVYADALGIFISLKGAEAGIQYGQTTFKELKTALKLNRKNPYVHLSYGVTYIKTPKGFGGDYNKALVSLKKAISLKSNFYEAYTWLGVLQKANGDLKKAEKNFRIALKINPDYSFAKYNLELLKKDLTHYKRFDGKKINKVAFNNIDKKTETEIGNILKTEYDNYFASTQVEVIKKKIMSSEKFSNVEFLVNNAGKDSVSIKINAVESRSHDVRLKLGYISPVFDKGDSGDIFPVASFFLYDNSFVYDDLRLLFIVTGPVIVAGIHKRHLFDTRFNFYTDTVSVFAKAGKYQRDDNGKIINHFDGHEFDVKSGLGFWLINEELNFSTFYNYFYGIYNESDQSVIVPDDGRGDSVGLTLAYNTVEYFGNESKEGVYFGITSEMSRSELGSKYNFEKYSIDFQYNKLFSHNHKLMLKSRLGLTEGLGDSPGELAHMFQVSGNYQPIVNPVSYNIHGLYYYEFFAKNIFLVNLAYKFPIVTGFSFEVDLDYCYLEESDSKRNVFGSAAKLHVDYFPDYLVQLILGFAENAKRENNRAYEAGFLVERLF